MSPQEINERVAVKLGWKECQCSPEFCEAHKAYMPSMHKMPNYCGDIGAAWEIMEYMANEMLIKEIEVGHSRSGSYWYCKLNNADFTLNIFEGADTVPMAIAMAFLKMGEK